MKIQFYIKDPDAIFDIAGYLFPRSEKKREKWRDKYTEYGDYITIKLNLEDNTFTFVPN